MNSLKLITAVIIMLAFAGCQKAPSAEKGYRHMFAAIHLRDMSVSENLENDGSTCVCIHGTKICAKTREEANELAAQWIEKNIPVPVTCTSCKESK